MRAAAFTYKLLSKKAEKNAIEINQQTELQDIRERLKMDVSVVVEMLESGYSMLDVIECIRKHSFMAGRNKNKDLITAYIDQVLSRIRPEQLRRSGNDYQAAQIAYRSKYQTLRKKYENYMKENFCSYHEGMIVNDLLIKEKFSPAVIRKVIERNSAAANVDEAYIEAVMQACLKVQRRYKAIENAANIELQTPGDLYRLRAYNYMKETNSVILNARDELRIIMKLYDEILKEQKASSANENMAEKLLKDKIRPFLLAVLEEASPVAEEAGRDKTGYIAALLGEFELALNTKNTNHHYTITENMYSEISNKFKQQITVKQEMLSDGIIAKELMEDRQPLSNIIRAIAEKSESVTEKENPFTYAKKIVEAAKKSLSAEREIFYFAKSLPKGESYKELCKAGYTVQDLYLQAMKERLTECPSFIRKMSMDFADEDIVEKLLYQYMDIDKQALLQAVTEKSPRAQLMPDAKAYAQELLKNVQRRLKENEQRYENSLKVQKEFNRLRGLASEGVHVDHAMDKYKDGKVALKMLQKGTSREDIKQVLVTMAQSSGIEKAPAYAAEIMRQVETVHERIETIQNYRAKDEDSKAAELYLQEMKQVYRKKNFLQTDTEVETVKNMLLQNCTLDDVAEIIKEYSPIAAEPGRDAHYIEYITELAQRAIEREQQRLASYRVIPRIEHCGNALSEYKYHLEALQKSVRLPFVSIMDTLIASAMLMQGFKEKEIKAAILTHSPIKDKNRVYASGIVRAANAMLKEKEHENALVRSRSAMSMSDTE